MNKLFITLLILSCYLTILIKCARPSDCELSSETGPCRGMFLKFYFNPTTNQCEEFNYGGCGGNENRFDTVNDCMNKCANDGQHNG